jgi:hypothetical protein
VAERSRGEAAVTEEEEAGRSLKDLFTILEISRDSSIKKEFPLIQNPNEKNVLSKVVKHFKPYNNALGFKFKISKDTVLF